MINLALAGGWSGNGGISSKDVNNPWFLGEESIPYCLMVEKNPDLPIAPAIQQMIRLSQTRWNSFFDKYKLNDSFDSDQAHFPDQQKRKINLQLSPSTDCADVEKYCQVENTDEDSCHSALENKILFLLGAPNSVIKKYLEVNGAALGASVRTDYNHKTYRSGGIVWINSIQGGSWSQYSHMLLHEIGHVFGMKHDSCWVMAANVAEFVLQLSLNTLETIESPTWPYSFSKGELVNFTNPKIHIDGVAPGYDVSLYYLHDAAPILGFKPNGYFKATGEIKELNAINMDINIIFEEFGTGLKQTLSGHLISSDGFFQFKDFVPSLFTNWIRSDNRPYLDYFYLQSGWSAQDYQGVIVWNNMKIPVLLTRHQGLKLSLYFPGTDSWVEISSIRSLKALPLK